MGKPRTIKELLEAGGSRLANLEAASRARSRVLEQVRSELPDELSHAVVTAGIEGTCLTLGVTSAVWAARLRYATDALRPRLGAALGLEIERARIKVVPPG